VQFIAGSDSIYSRVTRRQRDQFSI
jgi:hypothetical protein